MIIPVTRRKHVSGIRFDLESQLAFDTKAKDLVLDVEIVEKRNGTRENFRWTHDIRKVLRFIARLVKD